MQISTIFLFPILSYQDVTLIKTNAETFNADGSMIVLDASMVVQILIWYIDDPKCVDIMPLYHKVSKEMADPSSDEDRKLCFFSLSSLIRLSVCQFIQLFDEACFVY